MRYPCARVFESPLEGERVYRYTVFDKTGEIVAEGSGETVQQAQDVANRLLKFLCESE